MTNSTQVASNIRVLGAFLCVALFVSAASATVCDGTGLTLPGQAAEAAERPNHPIPVKSRAVALDVELSRPSGLPAGARLDGDILTVAVPPGSAEQGCMVSIPLDPAVFTKWPFMLEMDVWSEDVSSKPNPWNGVKMMVQAQSILGENFYPQAEFPTGTVSRTNAVVSFDYLGTLSERVALQLGLERVTGTAHFDLSSFRAWEIRKFPKTNETYRIRYPGRIAKMPHLRGVMLPAPENITEADFDQLADWGVTLVRFQMTGGAKGWDSSAPLRSVPGWYRWLDKEMHILDQVLAWADARGILVCVDLHSVPGGRVWPRDEHRIFVEPGYAELLVDTWERIARRYRGDGRIFGFDLINEPIQRNSDVEIGCWELQERIARAVRAIDPDRTIVMEANFDDSHNGMAIQSPLAMDNVIYEFHMYQPLAYTHQYVIGVTAQDVKAKGIAFKPKPYPNADWHNPDLSTTGRLFDKDYLRRAVQGAREFQLRHNARIYVGEFSVAAWAPGADRYIADCADIFAEYGWDWTYHAFREYEAWSVEQDFPIPPVFGGKSAPSEDNPRKRALLNAIKGIRPAS